MLGPLGRRTPGSLMPQSPHFGGLPRFLRCWYWSFPPGVLMTRTLLERVLYLYRIAESQPWPHSSSAFFGEEVTAVVNWGFLRIPPAL